MFFFNIVGFFFIEIKENWYIWRGLCYIVMGLILGGSKYKLRKELKMFNLNIGDVLINGIRKNNKFIGNECICNWLLLILFKI